MKKVASFVVVVLVGVVALGYTAFHEAPSVEADTPTNLVIAIPSNVTINVGDTGHFVEFVGKPTSTSPVECGTGVTPQQQTVVAVDPQSGLTAEVTGVLVFHDHQIPAGARYQIFSGPVSCGADLRLYTGRLVN